MIDWGFLRRLSKDDGVPRGKFAVRMEGSVFESFRSAFASTADFVVDAGQTLMKLHNQAPNSPLVDEHNILKFRVTR
jgi:hypothetical protein